MKSRRDGSDVFLTGNNNPEFWIERYGEAINGYKTYLYKQKFL